LPHLSKNNPSFDTPASQQREWVELDWNGEAFVLLPEKAVLIPGIGAILIADPHFGKAAHFRKAGIPIPERVHTQDFLKIQKLIQYHRAKEVYFLGDLFHSDWNTSWNDLEEFAGYFPGCQFHLVKGNHDILPEKVYRLGIWEIHTHPIEIGKFLLSHEPLENTSADLFNFCGHIHPGIALYGNGRQRMVLPCFFQKERQMVLPAFGRFTGIVSMAAIQSDRAFAIAGKKVIEVKFC
jgi:DNA ligase-associated metallophosphoesterase